MRRRADPAAADCLFDFPQFSLTPADGSAAALQNAADTAAKKNLQLHKKAGLQVENCSELVSQQSRLPGPLCQFLNLM
jgi:hypothetical protein